MKLPKIISDNLVLKITSVNAVVISIRLVISFFIQNVLARLIGEAGYALIGQLRNIMGILTSTSTLGVFNGVVKYTSEFKNHKPELVRLFSTVTVFTIIGSILTSLVLYMGSDTLALKLFKSANYNYIFQLLAVVVPFIAIHRVFYSVISGLSDYKNYAKVELISYFFGAALLVFGLYHYNIDGVLIAIAITPIIHLIVLLFVFGKTLITYLQPKLIRLNLNFKNQLLSFTLMSFVSTILLNYIEIHLRTLIANDISTEEAGNWTAMLFLSKNYMVFSTGIFSLYILPKFAEIKDKQGFKNEVIHIYKTMLPIFGLGMLLVYVLRSYIVHFVFPGFNGMDPLFKWQLLGDFIRLATIIIGHQFLAKKLVKSFVITEVISVMLFYVLAIVFIQKYQTEGIVIAHFVRYIIYFVIVVIFVWHYFNNQNKKSEVPKQ